MTNKSAKNEIEQLIKSFEYFIEKYENFDSDSANFTNKDIKSSFDNAKFIETTIKELSNRLILPQFLSCLNKWLHSKNYTKRYDIEFFQLACDYLLLKYFNSKINIEIAIDIFISICTQDRLQNVIEKAILKHSTFDPLLSYIVSNKTFLESTQFQSELFLLKCKNDISCGKINQVQQLINSKLEPYIIDKYLPLFLYILNLNTLQSEDLAIQQIILDQLLCQMDDRSVLGKDFWLTLFKDIDKKLLTELCSKNIEFLKSLINFIIYCLCMMDYTFSENGRIWTANCHSICPQIVFTDVVDLIDTLIENNSNCIYIKHRIEESKERVTSLIWSDIIKECF